MAINLNEPECKMCGVRVRWSSVITTTLAGGGIVNPGSKFFALRSTPVLRSQVERAGPGDLTLVRAIEFLAN